MICSTRTRCWTRARPRSRAWSRRAQGLAPVLVVGAPLRFEAKLFNCAVVIYRGRVLGLVPKTYLPNYREYYEKRQFASSRDAVSREVLFLGERVPFGNDLIFEAGNVEGFKLHAEICEDVWTPIPPSTYAALAGATVLVNLSASNITIGKAEYRRNLCASQSGKCIAAYLYSCAGPGESTTDLAWDGHALIYENADLLAESERFADREQMITADIDLERLVQDRMRMTSFSDSVGDCRERLQAMRRIPFEFRVPAGKVALQRHDRAVPLRAERSARARPALLRGLQHPGAQPAQAAGRAPGPSGWSSASPAAWTRRTRSSSPPRRWTGWACRGRTSWPTRCRALPPASSRSAMRTS